MSENYTIEDKNWENLAKRFYDQDSEIQQENSPATSVPSGLKSLVEKVDLYFELKKYRADEAWEKVEARISDRTTSRRFNVRRLIANPVFRYAAAVLIAAVFLVAGYEYALRPTKKELVSASQVLKTFTLPDGTKVSLNSNSTLTYPEQFSSNVREVSISGEAFFEVKPDPTKPFIIQTGQAQIKVLGTSFTVSAYPKSTKIEVIVETGKVQFTNTKTAGTKAGELILTPGEKGILDVSGNALHKTANQNPNYLAWKTRNLIFKATSLAEVIKDLENVYKVNIRLADPRLNGLLLSAQFNDYSLDFILKVIESTFNIEVLNQNGQYILKAKS